MLISHLLNLLFPERTAQKRPTFDFSDIPPPEMARRLSRNRDPVPGQFSGQPITACLSYKNPLVKTLIWHIKTRRDAAAFACGAYILNEELGKIIDHNEHLIIIPMPIHRKRRHERGYNQCELLVAEMERQWKNSNEKRSKSEIQICNDILSRREQKHMTETNSGKKKQAFRNRTERIEAVRGMFSIDLHKLQKIDAHTTQKFILIDDVITTGSTMNEALRIFRNAGCKNIAGLTLAH